MESYPLVLRILTLAVAVVCVRSSQQRDYDGKTAPDEICSYSFRTSSRLESQPRGSPLAYDQFDEMRIRKIGFLGSSDRKVVRRPYLCKEAVENRDRFESRIESP